MTSLRTLALAPALLFVVNGAFGAVEIAKEPKPYTLDTCAVDGKKLDAKPFMFLYKNYEIKVCSEAEKATFMSDADANLTKVKAAETKAAKAAAPKP